HRPVYVTANTTYIASYFAPVGHYSYTGAQFAAGGVTNGLLRALGNGESPNGVFRYTSDSAFPNQSFNATNYFVDVVFETTLPNRPPSTDVGYWGRPLAW